MSVCCRVGKHVGEFESVFLSDLEGGNLPFKEPYFGLEGEFCNVMQCEILFNLQKIYAGLLIKVSFLVLCAGELWMNLDGDISPVCLNILHCLPLRCSNILTIFSHVLYQSKLV